MGINFYLDPATINTVSSSNRGLLKVPTHDENDTLVERNGGNKKWREHVTIKATGSEIWEKDKDIVIVKVQYAIDEGYYPPNGRRIFTKSYFINGKAVKDTAHESNKRTVMTLGKLVALARVCGVAVEASEGEKFDLLASFDDGSMVGKSFWAVFRDYNYEKDGQVKNDQDIDNFIKDETA